MYVVVQNFGVVQMIDIIQDSMVSMMIFVFVSFIFWLWGCKIVQQCLIVIVIRENIEVIVLIYFGVLFVIILQRVDFIVFWGWVKVGVVINCILIKIVIIMLVFVRLISRQLVGVFIDLFFSIIRIINVLLIRLIIIIVENNIEKLVYIDDNMVLFNFQQFL